MLTANEALQHQIILHEIHSARFGAGLAEEIVRLLDASSEALMGELVARLDKIKSAGVDRGPATTARINSLVAYVQGVNDQVYKKKLGPTLRKRLEAYSILEGTEHHDMLRNAITVDFPVTLPPAATLKAIVTTAPIDGHLLASHIDQMSANRTARISQAIRTGFVNGDTIDAMSARIRGTKEANFEDGTLEISRRSARNLAITGTSTVSNNARLATYQANAKLVRKVRWISTLDSRTSPVCQQRDGQVYPIDKPHPVPPAHIRCRSTLLPVTVSWRELGIDKDDTPAPGRAAMDGQVAADTTYEKWLRAQTDATQNDVLGTARADLFRTGKGDFRKDFFRDDGAYRSVDELRSRLDAAKQQANIPVPPKPKAEPTSKAEPSPAQPKRLETPINPAVNDATVKVEPRLAIQKRLTATMRENAADSRYSPLKEFRDRKEADFGVASFGPAFSDEAVSMIAALLPELDKLADAFDIPRIRGIKSLSGGKAVANMGDGVLGVHPDFFNVFASKVGAGGATDLAETKLADLSAKAKAAAERAQAIRDKLDAGQGSLSADEIDKLWREWEIAFKEYRLLNERLWKQKKSVRTTTKEHTVSTWKPGDDPNTRPWTIDYNFDGIDRARSILFHEFAHHVHQSFKRKGPRRQFGPPPLEVQGIATAYRKLTRADMDQISSKYALTNRFEWFAEQFAGYMMGRRDLVSKQAIELIEGLLDEKLR